MFDSHAKIVWLVYPPGFGGDQLYWLLNQTGKFCYLTQGWSRLTDHGKRLVEDLFEFKFQQKNAAGRDLTTLTGIDELVDVMNSLVIKLEDVNDWHLPVILKTHQHHYFDQYLLKKISPDCKIIYMISNSGNEYRYLQMALKKNQEFPWMQTAHPPRELFEAACRRLAFQYSTAHAVDVDLFFNNDAMMWQKLFAYLELDIDPQLTMDTHAEYVALQEKI
jgi:hypothetical protein